MDVVAVDLAGKRLANQALDVEVQRFEWTNRFVADTSGGGRWESNEERIPVTQQRLTTNERGEAVLTFTPEKAAVIVLSPARATVHALRCPASSCGSQAAIMCHGVAATTIN